MLRTAMEHLGDALTLIVAAAGEMIDTQSHEDWVVNLLGAQNHIETAIGLLSISYVPNKEEIEFLTKSITDLAGKLPDMPTRQQESHVRGILLKMKMLQHKAVY